MTFGTRYRPFSTGCDGLVGLALIGLGHDVGAQALAGFQRVGQWLDAVGIDGLHLVDQPENAVQGVGNAWKIGIIQAQAGQMGDLFHVGAFKRHGISRGNKNGIWSE
jgi:hypothetical protein